MGSVAVVVVVRDGFLAGLEAYGKLVGGGIGGFVGGNGIWFGRAVRERGLASRASTEVENIFGDGVEGLMFASMIGVVGVKRVSLYKVRRLMVQYQ